MRSGFFNRIFHRDAAFAVLLSCAASFFPAYALNVADSTKQSAAGIVARYPAGSIHTSEAADRALVDVEGERARIEERFHSDEAKCYNDFFASVCLDKAKERRRVDLQQLRSVEQEAKQFKRQARVAERDKALAEKQQADADKARTTATDGALPFGRALQDAAEPPNNASTAAQGNAQRDAAVVQRVRRHKEKLQREQEAEAAQAQKRAENVSAYERKVKEAQARQQELETRRIEKSREREARQKQVPASSTTNDSKP